MKKLSLLLLISIMLLIFVGCIANPKEENIPKLQEENPVNHTEASLPQTEAVLKAKIMKVYDASVLVGSIEDDARPSDIYMIPLDVTTFGTSNLQAGAIVEIGYDGAVMEIYPAKLGAVEYIKVVEQKDDMVGFYETVFNELWETDKALNANIDMVAFDLSNADNLTDTEKNALIYILGNTFGLQTVTGTFEQLCDEGYIDKENLVFENGILLKLEVLELAEDSFKFNAEKWRSGLGAYSFHDCTAKKTTNGWEYTIGSEMIS